jgi:hypothetical protein
MSSFSGRTTDRSIVNGPQLTVPALLHTSCWTYGGQRGEIVAVAVIDNNDEPV